MKKVLFVATVVKTHINTFHLPFLKMFHEAGWEVHVAAKNDFSKDELFYIPYCDIYYDVPFERFPFSKTNVIAYRKLKEIMQNNQYDIIHCHTPVGGVLARLAGRYCLHTRMIYTAHGFHFYNGAPLLNWLLYYPVERICAHYTDTLITINKEDYQRALRFHLRNEGTVYHVPGIGVNLNKYKKNDGLRTATRKQLGLDTDTKFILTVGELSKRKNQGILIKALHRVTNEHFICYICGQGPLQSKLQALIYKLGLDDRIKLVGFRSDIAELCLAADIFVFPSLQEGLPVAIMEAMASGVPIVCSNIRGNVDLVHDGKNGYVVNCDDIKGFAEKISYLLYHQNIREQFIINNTKEIQKYSLQSVSRIMKNIYGIS